MITNTHPIEITGLAKLAADLPDEGWYEMRVRLRKGPNNTAEICIDPENTKAAAWQAGVGIDAETDNEVRAHISWLRLYAREMSEANWRDMQLYLERQINRLAEALYGPAPPSHFENEGCVPPPDTTSNVK